MNEVSLMAKKQVIVNESAAAATPARAAKARAPRVKAAQHKVVSADLAVSEPVAAMPVPTRSVSAENPHDAIARIAYSLWETRGSESGSALEDWLRAEQHYLEVTAQ